MRILFGCSFGLITTLVVGPSALAIDSQSPTAEVTFRGLQYTALGQATLDLQANATELAVGNLGSSGQDGVAVSLSGHGRWDAQWKPLDSDGGAPAGVALQATVLGALGDGTVSPLGVLTSAKLGPAQYGLSADFATLGASTYTVDVYDGAKLVSHLTGQSSKLVTSSLPNWDLHIGCCPFTMEVTWRGGGSSGTLFTFAGSSSISGDRIVVTPEKAKDVTALASVELRARGLPLLTLVPPQPAATTVIYDGLQHAALGSATLELQANGTALAIGNLGSSGQDGVAVTLPAHGRWDAQWQPLDPDGAAPQGAYLEGTVLGSFGDGTARTLGVLRTSKLATGQYGLAADFSPLGASTYTLDVYDGAKLVRHLTGQGNKLVTSDRPNWDLHIGCCPFTLEVTWRGGGSSGTLLTFAGGSSAFGDRLVVTPETAKDVTALASVELRARGLALLTLVPPQQAATAVTFGGLQYASLGLATLDLEANGTELLLGNLGSSGQDGVAVSVPAHGRWDAQWQPLDTDGAAPLGAFVQTTVVGALADGAEQKLGVVKSTKLAPALIGLNLDFSPLGASTYTLDIYDGAKLVGHLTGLPGTNLVTSSRPNWDAHISCCPFTLEITWRGGGGTSSGTLFTTAAGSSVAGDRLVVTPEKAKEVSALASVELRASGFPLIHFVPPQPAAATLAYAGLQQAALGSATLELQANGTELVVANLGSSGQDGVAVTLPAHGRWDAQWQPLDPDDAAPKGAALQTTLVGALGDGSVRPLGVLTTTKLGSALYGLGADLSALGATSYTVDVYDGAKLVSHQPGLSGSNLLTCAVPNLDLHVTCCPPFILEVTWRRGGDLSGTAFTFAGGTTVPGDRVVVTPENAKEVSSLAGVELRASGFPLVHFVPPQPAAATLTYGGLQHAALGLATLELQANGSELVVGNLGSSGQDGVAITVPAHGRWDAQWQPLDTDGAAPKGAVLESTVLGALADGAVRPLGRLTSTKIAPALYGLAAEFPSLGASTYSVDVYDGAKLVSHLPGQPGTNLVTSTRPNWDVHISCCPFTFEVTWSGGGSGSTSTLFTFAGGSTVSGDRLVVTPENAKDVSALASVEVRASGFPLIHFVTPQAPAASLTYGGLVHTALGSATLELQANGAELAVANLGSSGQDGVSVALLPNGRWDAQWQPLDPDGAAPKGAFLQETVVGALGDGSVRPLGVLTSTKLGPSQYVLSADFSPLGATTYTIDIYDGAKQVGHLPGQAGSNLVSSAQAHLDVHVTCCPPFIIQLTWRGRDLYSGTQFTLPGGGTVHADRVLLTPENAKEVSSLAAIELRASGLSQIHFVPPQPAAVTLTYGGLQHAALGSATLALQANGTELVVDNLGSSGQDGVAITLPAHGRWDAQWQPLDADGTAAKGASLESTVLGALGDGSVRPLGSVRSTKLGPAQYELTADFSALGASTYTVDIYDGAKLVNHLTGQGSKLVASTRPNWDLHIGCCPFTMEFTWRGGGSSGTLFTLPGGSTVPGDRLVLTPEKAQEVGALASIELRASGLPLIHFVPPQPAASSVTFAGLPYAALGLAALELQANGTQLVASNLGSSGQDGVSVTLPARGRWDAAWQPWDTDDADSKAASLQTTVLGALTDGSVQSLGTLTSTKLAPGQYALTADFAALGTATYTVDVYDGAKLVRHLPGQPGTNLVTSSRPNWDLHIGCCPFIMEVTWRGGGGTSSGTLFTLAGQGSIPGDRLIVTPENGKDVTALASIELRPRGLALIALVPPYPDAPALVYGGLPHAALGLATLDLQTNNTQLAVGNLGSSGQDGVSIGLNRAERWDASWLDTGSASNGVVGAALQIDVFGSAASAARKSIGTITVTKTAAGTNQILADFSSLNSTSRTAQVYLGTNLVAEVPHQTGPVAMVSGWPLDFHLSLKPLTVTITFRGSGTGSTGVDLALNGGGTPVHGDRLVLIPDQASAVDFYSEVQLRASGISNLVFTTQETHLVPLQLGAALAQDGSLTLQWPGNGVLEQSTDLKQWTPVPLSTTSPFRPVLDGLGRFYRVIEPALAP